MEDINTSLECYESEEIVETNVLAQSKSKIFIEIQMNDVTMNKAIYIDKRVDENSHYRITFTACSKSSNMFIVSLCGTRAMLREAFAKSIDLK
jgi:hypothetical protein